MLVHINKYTLVVRRTRINVVIKRPHGLPTGIRVCQIHGASLWAESETVGNNQITHQGCQLVIVSKSVQRSNALTRLGIVEHSAR